MVDDGGGAGFSYFPWRRVRLLFFFCCGRERLSSGLCSGLKGIVLASSDLLGVIIECAMTRRECFPNAF